LNVHIVEITDESEQMKAIFGKTVLQRSYLRSIGNNHGIRYMPDTVSVKMINDWIYNLFHDPGTCLGYSCVFSSPVN